MTWTELLRSEMEVTYRITESLMELVDAGSLAWKPSDGQNWMTTGQLLRHISTACGSEMKGFVSGDWGAPAGTSADSSLPAADQLPTVGSVVEARKGLAADRELASRELCTAGEERLDREPTPAPWDSTRMPLGRRLLEVIRHLDTHKSQLFYYLKLQGKPVTTSNLWGI